MRKHEMRWREGRSGVGTLEALEGSMCFLAEAERWRPQVEQGAGKSRGPQRVLGRIFDLSSTPGHSALRSRNVALPSQAAHPGEMRWDHLTKGNTTQISADGKQ